MLSKLVTGTKKVFETLGRAVRGRHKGLDDSGGDEALNVVLGVLVAVVFIGIVMNIMKPQITAWANSITTKVSTLLADGGGGGGGT